MNPRLVLSVMLLGSACNSLAAVNDVHGWPRIAAPIQARQFAIDDELVVNGVSMRITGFLAALPIESVLAHYRAELGPQRVEDTHGTAKLLARAIGDYFVTVRLQAVAGKQPMTRGLVAVSHLAVAAVSRERDDEIQTRWRSSLPAGTRLLSRLDSQLNGRVSRHLMFTNTYSVTLNGERIAAAMAELGMKPTVDEKHPETDRRLFLFQGEFREANVVIAREPGLHSVIVIHETSPSPEKR
jgi:hypothetical protein